MKRALLLLALVACTPRAVQPQNTPEQTYIAPYQTQVATASPFLPLKMTPSPTVATSTPWAYPTAIYDNIVKPLPPMPILEDEPHIIVIALLGSDTMPHRRGSENTDAIMLLIVDTIKDEVALVSLPRDLYVFIPGFGMSRINRAYELRGPQGVADTIRYNFGLEVNKYVYIDMLQLEEFIDHALGGIEVDVEEAVYDRCGDKIIDYKPGLHYMDGKTAVCYARVRMMSTDYDRMRRQQEVFSAMKNKFYELSLPNLLVFLDGAYAFLMDSGVRTDMTLTYVGIILNSWPLERWDDSAHTYRLVPPLVRHFDHPETGAWLLEMPEMDCTIRLMFQVLDFTPWYGCD